MKVVVESLGNEIISDYCFKGWIGATNAGHDVEKMSLSKAAIVRDRLIEERPMPIGSVEYMEYFFDLYGIEKPMPLHIGKYMSIFGRDTWVVEDLRNLDYSSPVFVKPLRDVKKFTGFVSTKKSDWDLYPELDDWYGPLLCSKPFKHEIVSEWRMFIKGVDLVNISIYGGDYQELPNPSFINYVMTKVITNSLHLPHSYTIDIAVLSNGNCEVVELNDMWAIGPYGCPEDVYFDLLKVRWNEIQNQ